MTTKEILRADLLDILFEDRNKAYGAYALRKNYNQRLQWALVISLGSAALFLLLYRGKITSPGILDSEKPGVIISTVELPKPKLPDIPQPKKMPAQAQIKSVGIKITSDDQVPKPEVPTMNDLQTALTSRINLKGIPTDVSTENIEAGTDKGNGEAKGKNQETVTHATFSDAQFPGGKEAFAKFLTKYLVVPGDLEAGEKKLVLVRFMVDIDGSISRTQIVQSDNENYSREVLRVLVKMPKWIPAMQNGIRTVTWFTQPVTFIGAEQ